MAILLLAMRAFASGAVALTGTEAIATGVPSFEPPESKNAATTLAIMAVLLAVLFIGITFLASGFAVVPNEEAHGALAGGRARLRPRTRSASTSS